MTVGLCHGTLTGEQLLEEDIVDVIRVFGMRVPKDGHVEYVCYDAIPTTEHTTSEQVPRYLTDKDNPEPLTTTHEVHWVVCKKTLTELAEFTGRKLFSEQVDFVRICVLTGNQLGHLPNYVAFRALPDVRDFRGVENALPVRFDRDQQELFLRMLQAELVRLYKVE